MQEVNHQSSIDIAGEGSTDLGNSMLHCVWSQFWSVSLFLMFLRVPSSPVQSEEVFNLVVSDMCSRAVVATWLTEYCIQFLADHIMH